MPLSSGNPGRMEYRGVVTKTKNNSLSTGPFEEGTNNIGEFFSSCAWFGFT